MKMKEILRALAAFMICFGVASAQVYPDPPPNPPAPNNGANVPSVTAYGAQCNSTGATGSGADDTAAFQRAANANPLNAVPANVKCRITAPVTVQSGVTGGSPGFIGDGENSSWIVIDNNNQAAIVFPANVNNPYLGSLRITRATGLAASVAGATNVDLSAGTNNGGRLEKLILEFGFNNISLGPTDHASIRDMLTWKAQNDGVFFQNTATSGSLQWQLDNVLSTQNVLNGFEVKGVNTGPAAITFGEWHWTQTFANTGNGIKVQCLVTIPCNSLRIRQPFLGQDGNDEIFLDTFNQSLYPHIIETPYIELAGTGSTGPALATAASHVGHGVQISNNNTGINLIAPMIFSNSYAGIYILGIATGGYTQITGGNILNNGQNVGVFPYGISNQGTNPTIVLATQSGNSPSLTTQQYGLTLASGTDNNNIVGNLFLNNSTQGILNASTGTHNRLNENIGYNPVGTTTGLTAGASPFTYTAGPQFEDIYITQSATFTATVSKGGANVCPTFIAGLICHVSLGPNEALIMTWATTAPGYSKDQH
jgi:hypothetical protein